MRILFDHGTPAPGLVLPGREGPGAERHGGAARRAVAGFRLTAEPEDGGAGHAPDRDHDGGRQTAVEPSGDLRREIDILLDPVRLHRLELAEFLLSQAEVGPAVQ